MNGHGFMKTSSPKLTVPHVSEHASGPGVEDPQAVVVRVGDRAAGGKLHDQVGALAESGDRVAQPCRVERRPGVVVTDVDVDRRPRRRASHSFAV